MASPRVPGAHPSSARSPEGSSPRDAQVRGPRGARLGPDWQPRGCRASRGRLRTAPSCTPRAPRDLAGKPGSPEPAGRGAGGGLQGARALHRPRCRGSAVGPRSQWAFISRRLLGCSVAAALGGGGSRAPDGASCSPEPRASASRRSGRALPAGPGPPPRWMARARPPPGPRAGSPRRGDTRRPTVHGSWKGLRLTGYVHKRVALMSGDGGAGPHAAWRSQGPGHAAGVTGQHRAPWKERPVSAARTLGECRPVHSSPMAPPVGHSVRSRAAPGSAPGRDPPTCSLGPRGREGSGRRAEAVLPGGVSGPGGQLCEGFIGGTMEIQY